MSAPESLPALLRSVRLLEVAARRNVTTQLRGNYVTSVLGHGLEFHEARRYVQGESIRQIDWKITARLNEPHVKVFVEERERDVIVALDVSPSMHTGWQQRTKLETAVEVAATLAVSATEVGDRLGLVTFSNCAHLVLRPRRGRRQLYSVLRSLISVLDEPPGWCAETDPRAAIHAVQGLGSRRMVVFIVSDFIDHDVPDDLAYVRVRNDVSLIHVYDPLEYVRSSPVRCAACSPEGPSVTTALDFKGGGDAADLSAHLARAAARYRVEVGSLSTNDPVGSWLAGYFANHRRRRRP